MSKKQSTIPVILLILDYALVVAAFSLAYLFRDYLNDVFLIPFQQFLNFALLAAFLYVLIFFYLGLYAINKLGDVTDQFFKIVIGAISATTLSGAIIYFVRYFDYSRLIVGIALIISIIFIWLGRVMIHLFERILFSYGIGVENVLVIGSGAVLKTVLNGYQAEIGKGYKIAGVLLTGSEQINKITDPKTLGVFDLTELGDIIKQEKIREIVLADSKLGDVKTLEIINLCERLGVRFQFVPDVFDVATARIVTHDLAGLPLIELKPTVLEGWMVVVKRLMDLTLTSFGLILLSPLFLISAILIKLDSRGSVFFKHRRVGQNGQEFDLYKFRSMHMIEKEGQMLHASANQEIENLKEKQPNYKLEDDPRITKIGRFIRKTSIDELPQLWNVMRGELSLVGPRAYLARELEKQQKNYPQARSLVRRLLTVKPGITGVWQVSGRSNISFTERVAMDAYYATHADIWLDIKILLQTIPAVLKGSGAM